MASIAYVTDHEMIEFHRLHGNTQIIFWRPTSQKKFSRFHYGDYLFFLAKGSEKGKRREKGIIGYGRFTKEFVIGFEEMWRRFKTKTGYQDKEALYEAIIKVAKQRELPDKLHCLNLEDIVFFQSPVYLSELDIRISKQIESYIYLDQENSLVSSQIIQKGAIYGQDLWTSTISQENLTIEHDAIVCMLQNIYAKFKTEIYTSYEKNKIASFAKLFMEENTSRFITPGMDDFYTIEGSKLTIYLPCIASMQTFDRNILYCIGRYQMYQTGLNELNLHAELFILFDDDINNYWEQLLEGANIAYKNIHPKNVCRI